MVIPTATVVGALTTALHTSLSGTLVGFVVGLVLTFNPLYRCMLSVLRWGVQHVVPVLIVSVITGYLARAAQYSDVAGLRRARLPLYGVGVVLAIAVATHTLWMRSSVRSIAKPDAALSSRWRRLWRGAVWAGLQVLSTACVFAIGILLGWQLDIQRRAAVLDRVGRIGWWRPMAPGQWLRGGLWTPADVYLGEDAQDWHLKYLRGLPHIHWLTIASSQITDEGCRHLSQLTYLDSLNLMRTSFGDRGFRHLAGLPNLTTLYIDGAHITRDSFQIFGAFPRLNYLNISNVPLGGQQQRPIRLAVGLQSVSLRNCNLTDADLASFATTRFIRYLDLAANKISGAGLRNLTANANLATLNLNGNPLDDSYLAVLSGMSLNGLMIDGVPLSKAGYDAILRQRWLQDISLRESGISDEQFRVLLSLPKLQDAQLDGSRLTYRSMLGWRQRDVSLWVDHQTLSAADITRLGEIGPEVTLVECELTPDAVAELANYPRIFDAVDCRTQSRLERWLSRYAPP